MHTVHFSSCLLGREVSAWFGGLSAHGGVHLSTSPPVDRVLRLQTVKMSLLCIHNGNTVSILYNTVFSLSLTNKYVHKAFLAELTIKKDAIPCFIFFCVESIHNI